MAAIKATIKNLGLEDLKKRKEEISSFLLSFPDNKRNDQGWRTLDVINNLIVSIEEKDKFTEMVIRELFFE